MSGPEQFNQAPEEQKIRMRAFMDKPRQDGCAPLYTAAKNGDWKAIQVLLQYKVNVDVSGPLPDELTPLAIACRNGHDKAIQYLIESNANLSYKTKNNSSLLDLLLHAKFATPELKYQMVILLLQSGFIITQDELDEIEKKTIPATELQLWQDSLIRAQELRSKAVVRAFGDAAPIPTSNDMAAPMDQIANFLGFQQPVVKQ